MASYPEDYYYAGSERVFRTNRDILSSPGYDRFSSYSLAASPRYVHHVPSSYSSTSSRAVNGMGGANLWQTEKTLSGRIAPSPVVRDIHFDTYQSLPSPYKINSRTFQPPYSYVKDSYEDADRQTGDKMGKVGLSSKSRSLYDLSSAFLEDHNYGKARHDYYEDKDNHEEDVKIGIGRWNEDYIRRKQRNGALIIGPCAGLFNLGNTCFMNSILQCLASARPLVTYFLNGGYQKDLTKRHCSLVSAFAEVMYTLRNTHRAFAPDSFRYEIGLSAKAFAGYSQHDAQEFLSYLLQRLSEDLNRATRKSETKYSVNIDELSDFEKSERLWKDYLNTENSIITVCNIVDLFMGQLRSQLKCCECGTVSSTFDPCLGLSLPIKKSYSFITNLSDCFELYSQEEKLDGQDRTLCEHCKKKQKTIKRLLMEKFPKILVIHLKRFSKGRFGHSKLTTKVRCPMTLELDQFLSSSKVAGRVTYELFAVCNHTGTVSSGHYTATTKSRQTGQWYMYDDDRVAFIQDAVTIAADEAYILFYELCPALQSEF